MHIRDSCVRDRNACLDRSHFDAAIYGLLRSVGLQVQNHIPSTRSCFHQITRPSASLGSTPSTSSSSFPSPLGASLPCSRQGTHQWWLPFHLMDLLPAQSNWYCLSPMPTVMSVNPHGQDRRPPPPPPMWLTLRLHGCLSLPPSLASPSNR